MLDATSIDDLKELGFKGAHARALKKAFDPAPVQFIAPSPSPAPAPSPSPSATKKKTKTKKRAQPKAPEAPQAGGSYAPPQSQADPRYGQSPAASKMMQAPGKVSKSKLQTSSLFFLKIRNLFVLSRYVLLEEGSGTLCASASHSPCFLFCSYSFRDCARACAAR